MAYQSVNPFTNEVVKQYRQHTDEQAQQALARADALFHSAWAQGDIGPRLEVLRRLGDLLAERAEDLARIISTEMGKLIEQSRAEVRVCADIAHYYAENAKEFLAPVPYRTQLGDAWVQPHPVGVLVAVEPWNFPLYQLIRVMAPAMAVGNPVLVKHACIVPQCAEAFEQLVTEAGAPTGAYTNLFISSGQVADLIADDRVQGVALTGSERAGSAVAAQAAKYLKKSTMELGGNDVFVVLDDCDVAQAAAVATQARLFNSGQVCTSAKRYIVHEHVAEDFLAAVTERFKAVEIGDPLDESTTLAPLASETARDDLAEQVERALKNGATLHYGNEPIEHPGNFFQPTVLTGIDRDNPAYYEEFFGPVAQVYVVPDDDAAVALANDSHYGLGGTVFSGDTDRAKRLASRIHTGMVFINTMHESVPELPFGGIKRSGYGRELGDLGIKEFVNQKLVVVSKDA
ncbi:NAD-dependent succinate-semialdehyde dehydrogenase [Streptomyces sp. YIM 121038]|uniref:NAD-dependent succinate-semialdehyde dehydrogenase n=1 Tax=Streptomyces sp. YIM 121038 TaxID=2136401 RepID=UPI001110552A|nr:NAD-dependent succinate-semialdehyde dehydrogenase [Streptomyces sp. YIM 121038]